MQKAWCFGVLTAVVVASALWATALRGSPGIVHLTDGTQVSGDVDDSDNKQVTVTIHGVQEVFPRDSVDSIEYPGTADDQFAAKIAKLAPRDLNGRLAVARWAMDLRRYDLARRAAAEALDIDSANAGAKDLMRTITYQATLTTGAAAPSVTTQPTNSTAAIASGAEHPASASSRYLNDDQINKIRQIELKPDDQVRVAFNHDVRRRFLALGLADSATFYELNPTAQALEILTKGDPSMVGDVRILTDPAAIAEFRGGATRVQPMILGGCAVSGCHSAASAAGGFTLFAGESPAAAYSNFYTLQSYHVPATTFEMQRSMIDRSYPEKSLLLQYCLPQKLTDTPHPEALNFHPLFGGRNDPRYQSLLHWITYVLKPDGGIYADINYHATTEPAIAPPISAQQSTTLPSQPAGE